jgi:Bacterial Ig-like domain (group 2)
MKDSLTVTLGAICLCGALILSGCGSSEVNLTDITLSPISPTIFVGDTVQFTATASYSNGTMSDITKTANWTSSATSVATIDSVGSDVPGLATGVAPGGTTISVTLTKGSNTITGTTDLTVNANATPAAQPVEGMAPVYFRAAEGASTSAFLLDGRALGDETAFLTLASGVHRLASVNGRYIFVIRLDGYRGYTFDLLASGRILLDAGEADSPK